MDKKYDIVLFVSVNDRVVVETKAVADNLDIALLCAAAMKTRATEAANEIAEIVDHMRDCYDAAEPEGGSDEPDNLSDD